MSVDSSVPQELLELLVAYTSGAASDRQFDRLEELLDRSEEARLFYVKALDLHAGLYWHGRRYAADTDALRGIAIRSESELPSCEASLAAFLAPNSESVASPIGHSTSRVHPVFPAPDFLPATLHNPLTYLSSGWPAAYLIAVVIFAIGGLIGTFTYVSQPVEVVQESRSVISEKTASTATIGKVGQITGMADCVFEKGLEEGSRFKVQGSKEVASGRWPAASGRKRTDLKLASYPPLATGHLVRLGDTFALASGLLEITYETGAKVLLQGPVTYEVDSADGGFLSKGKLTARVEGNKVASGQWLVAREEKGRGERGEDGLQNAKCKVQSAKYPSLSTTHYPLPTLQSSSPQSLAPSPLFAVRTPTAVITDLGTEFGVEVDMQGGTNSHVFRGSVRVESIGDGVKTEGKGRVLHENESVRVEKRDGKNQVVIVTDSSTSNFVRELPTNSISVQRNIAFDLGDVVAGGDGFSGKRNAGIDPRNGRMVDVECVEYIAGDGRYHSVDESPLIDGVFVPTPANAKQPIQLDSAGHSYDGFSNSNDLTIGCVWGGIGEGNCALLGDVDYSSPGHSMIALHTNKGVTFDLEAIRRANPGWRLLRFRGMTGIASQVDENLIANGSFTSGLDGWKHDRTQGTVSRGDSSPDGHNMVLGGPCKVQYTIPLVSMDEKQQYTLSFTAAAMSEKSTGGTLPNLTVRFSCLQNGISTDTGEPLIVTADALRNGWATYTATWTAPAVYTPGAVCPRFTFEVEGTGANIAIDNVLFTREIGSGMADIRVFVDGQPRFQRREINIHSGAMPVMVPIKESDRFMTLVTTTNEDNHIAANHTMFGDPIIEIAPDGHAPTDKKQSR